MNDIKRLHQELDAALVSAEQLLAEIEQAWIAEKQFPNACQTMIFRSRLLYFRADLIGPAYEYEPSPITNGPHSSDEMED